MSVSANDFPPERPFLQDMLTVLRHVSWELPQTLLGAVLFFVVKVADRNAKSFRAPQVTLVTRTTALSGGVSLGMFLFSVDYERRFGRRVVAAQQRMEAHELGHASQSCLLGPLYLPLVGLPSISRATVFKLSRSLGRPIPSDRYYRGYPEAWADRLGGVRRPQR